MAANRREEFAMMLTLVRRFHKADRSHRSTDS